MPQIEESKITGIFLCSGSYALLGHVLHMDIHPVEVLSAYNHNFPASYTFIPLFIPHNNYFSLMAENSKEGLCPDLSECDIEPVPLFPW